jgi:hypothetical protein
MVAGFMTRKPAVVVEATGSMNFGDEVMSRIVVVALATAFAFSSTVNAQDEKKKKRGGDPEQTFKTMDADSDGKVTKEEFKEKAPGKMKERADQLFSRVDKDGNGSISLEEWKSFSTDRAKGKKKGDKKDPPKDEDKKDPPKEDK